MAIYSTTKEKDGVVYEVTPTRTLVIKDARNAKYNNLMIPAEVQGMPVVGVAARAFVNSKAKTVLFPATVVDVGSRAFYGNVNIKSVTFSAVEVHIGENAFDGCFKLQKIKGIKLYLNGQRVFNHCKALAEFDARLAGTVYSLSFANCKRLETLKFCNAVAIMDDAFFGCMSLRQVYFESNVTVNPSSMKFIEKRVIFCNPDCPLTELIYNGTDVRVGSFQ